MARRKEIPALAYRYDIRMPGNATMPGGYSPNPGRGRAGALTDSGRRLLIAGRVGNKLVGGGVRNEIQDGQQLFAGAESGKHAVPRDLNGPAGFISLGGRTPIDADDVAFHGVRHFLFVMHRRISAVVSCATYG